MTESNPTKINIKHEIVNDHRNLPNWNLNIFYANACSILTPGKFGKLKDILETVNHEVHIILLTETWFKTDRDAETVNLENYFHFYNFRGGARGGGISIYVKKYLEPQLTAEKYKKKVNYLWVYLEASGMNIGVIYNPGLKAPELQTFLEVYSTQLKERPRTIVFGDYNLDLLKDISKTYKETIKQANFTLLNKIHVKYFTRRVTETIIDHVCTNLDLESYKFHLSVIRSKSLSDHDHLYLGIRSDKFEVNQEDVPQTCQMNGDEHYRPRPVLSRRSTAEYAAIHLSDDDDSAPETNETRTARPRKKKRIDIEYTCHICFAVHEDANCHLRHLRASHQYTGMIEEKYAIRKCPHCVAIRLKQKEYNKHIQEFHADRATCGAITPSNATTSSAPTNTTVSSNNASTARLTTTSTRPVSTITTTPSVASSTNPTPTSTNATSLARPSIPSTRSSSGINRSLPSLQ